MTGAGSGRGRVFARRVATNLEGVTIEMELPAGRHYTFAIIPASDRLGDPLSVGGRGTQGHAVKPLGGLTCISALTLQTVHQSQGRDRLQSVLCPDRLADSIDAANPVRFLDAFGASLA